MRRKRIAALAVGTALTVGVGVVVALNQASDNDGVGGGVENTRSPEEISSYWTDERKRQATPG
ncbi:hypothetical protein [Actinomadura rudentiformis]|uniref:Uncharacterized protein n=1 Tax=Actinomadura rudentiformis TaxID=359158 RepID=A0A6H9YVF1_9ACTN|nr:hypothetical protein [Actinomadura rudentiformis]KAB2345573.1 hypothetical protein F8566_26880 [Actinomadura rudentiformis]